MLYLKEISTLSSQILCPIFWAHYTGTCPDLSPLDDRDRRDIYLKVCPVVPSRDEELSEKEKKDFTAENDQNSILSVDIKKYAAPDDDPGIIDHDRHGHFDETEFEEFEI